MCNGDGCSSLNVEASEFGVKMRLKDQWLSNFPISRLAKPRTLYHGYFS